MKTNSDSPRYGVFMDTMKRQTTLFAFLALCVAISFASPEFRSPANILNVLRQVSINGILAVGMTLVVITGGIDLSVGAIVALAGVLACKFAHPDAFPLAVPILCGVAAGLGCGALNGMLVAYGRIAPFIVTLGMMTAARGLSFVVSDGRPVIDLSDAYNRIGGGYLAGIPLPVIILFVVAALGHFILAHTRFGRHAYAVGGNEKAAVVSGINPDRIKIAVYALAGALAGLAGIVISSRVMAASPAAGQGYELDAIAAVVIGGTRLSGGVGTVPGTILGALLIGVINNALDLLGVSSYYQQIVKGAIIVLAVLVESMRGRPAGANRGLIKAALALVVAFGAISLSFAVWNRKPAPVPATGKTVTVGVSYQNLQNEFVINIQDALRKKAAELGVRIVEADGQGKAENQISQIENFIVQKVDAVVLNPFDRHSCMPAVDKAVAAGIPVVVVNAIVDNLDKAFAYVGSDDIEAGRIEMQYIAEQLGGKGNIVIIHGPNGHSAEIQRTQGIREILAKYPGIAVVAEQTANWDRAQAMALMENWLQSGKRIDAVAAQNDEMALGAYKAIEASKRTDIVVVGIDAIPDALAAVKNGSLAGTVFQDARGQGAMAIVKAMDAVQGRKSEHMNYIPFQLVTKTNLDRFTTKPRKE